MGTHISKKLSKLQAHSILVELGLFSGPYVSTNLELDRITEFAQQMTEEQFRRIMIGCMIIKEQVPNTLNSISLKEIINMCEKQNRALLRALGIEFDVLVKEQTITPEVASNIVRSVYAISKEEDRSVQKNSQMIMLDFISETKKIDVSECAKIGGVLYKYFIKKEQAEAVYNNCVKRVKSFAQNAKADRVEEVIKTLNDGLSTGNRLSDEEIIEISSKCASIFLASSKEKLIKSEQIIEKFKKYMLDNFECNLLQSLYKNQIDQLTDTKFKDILMQIPTIACIKSKYLESSLEFLSGKPLGEILDDTPSNKNWKEKYKNCTGEFSLEGLLNIFENNTTSLGVPTENVCRVLDIIQNGFERAFGKPYYGTSKIITERNFIDLKSITNRNLQSPKQFADNLFVLSHIFTPKAIETFLRERLDLLQISPADILNGIVMSALASSDETSLKTELIKQMECGFVFRKNNRQGGEGALVSDGNLHREPDNLGNVAVDSRKKNRVSEMSDGISNGNLVQDNELFVGNLSDSISVLLIQMKVSKEEYDHWISVYKRSVENPAQVHTITRRTNKRPFVRGTNIGGVLDNSKKDFAVTKQNRQGEAERSTKSETAEELKKELVALRSFVDRNKKYKSILTTNEQRLKDWERETEQIKSALQAIKFKINDYNTQTKALKVSYRKQVENLMTENLKQYPPNQCSFFDEDFEDLTNNEVLCNFIQQLYLDEQANNLKEREQQVSRLLQYCHRVNKLYVGELMELQNSYEAESHDTYMKNIDAIMEYAGRKREMVDLEIKLENRMRAQAYIKAIKKLNLSAVEKRALSIQQEILGVVPENNN